MTKEQYERWSAPYRTKKSAAKLLIWMDRCITGAVFLSYPMLCLCLWRQRDVEKLFWCMLLPAVSFLALSVFRRCFCAPRPYEVLDIRPLIPKGTKGKSFPSRHIFSVFIIGMTFWYAWRPMGVCIGALGFLLAYIRVVGGVHFPKDVAAGALFGMVCGLFYYLL